MYQLQSGLSAAVVREHMHCMRVSFIPLARCILLTQLLPAAARCRNLLIRWSFYGTFMFAKPVAVGTAVMIPYWIYFHYDWEKVKEQEQMDASRSA